MRHIKSCVVYIRKERFVRMELTKCYREVHGMESKEPVYFICQSKLDALEEMLDSFTRKYSLYSKYAEGKK